LGQKRVAGLRFLCIFDRINFIVGELSAGWSRSVDQILTSSVRVFSSGRVVFIKALERGLFLIGGQVVVNVQDDAVEVPTPFPLTIEAERLAAGRDAVH
jgi:hypothetical protein